MIWLAIFGTLTAIEVGYLWFQWDKISNIIEVTKLASNLVDGQLKDNDSYKKLLGFKERVAMFLLNFKGLIVIPIILILLANSIIGLILSLIINLILLMF